MYTPDTLIVDPLELQKLLWPDVHFYDKQREVIYSVADNDETFVPAGNMLGKDFVSAFIALWFFLSRHPCRVLTTSVDSTQLEGVLWGEIRRFIQTSKYPLEVERGGPLIVNHLHLRKAIPSQDGKGTQMCGISYLIGRVAAKGEGMLGHHVADIGDGVPRTLFIADECCHDSKTEVLTELGWKFFSELDGSERLLTMNPNTRVATYQRPTAVYATKYSGPMYSYSRRAGNFMVTPNHKMLWRKRVPSWSPYKNSWQDLYVLEEIKDIAGERSIPRCFRWEGLKSEWFTIPKGCTQRTSYNSCKVPMVDWVRFLGWYVSEGNLVFSDGKPRGVVISQSNQTNLDEIERVCYRIGVRYHRYGRSVVFAHPGIANYLHQYGRYSYQKWVPDVVHTLSPELIEEFLQCFKKGDGYDQGDGGREVLYTSSKRLADDLQILSYKAGREATVKRRPLIGRPAPNGTSRHDGYVVARSRPGLDSHIKVTKGKLRIVDYSGEVFCANVPPHHTLFTRRHGVCMWSGNSGVEDLAWERADTWAKRKLAIGNPYPCVNFFYRGVKAGDLLASEE